MDLESSIEKYIFLCSKKAANFNVGVSEPHYGLRLLQPAWLWDLGTAPPTPILKKWAGGTVNKASKILNKLVN